MVDISETKEEPSEKETKTEDEIEGSEEKSAEESKNSRSFRGIATSIRDSWSSMISFFSNMLEKERPKQGTISEKEEFLEIQECPKCGSEISTERDFCPECEEPLEQVSEEEIFEEL